MLKIIAVVVCSFFLCDAASAQTRWSHPDSVRIITSDITNFWQAYDRLSLGASRADSIQAFRTGYFDEASPGLTAFIDARLKQPDNLLRALGMLPRYYAAVRPSTLELSNREPVVRQALRKLQDFYPAATFPDIYFVIAGFISQGAVIDGKMLLAGEMVTADANTPMQELPPFLRDVDLSAAGLPCILVHELVHFQQNNVRDRSLLAQSLLEGVADFITDKAIGCVPTAAATYEYGESHERELWAQFASEMDGTDHSNWLYNGSSVKDRPSQLGYWMGYQIAEAYYNRASDKSRAVRELLNIEDYKRILRESGYGFREK